MNEERHGRVVAKIVGGLGNQMFCYAAARSLALRTGAELVLDVDFFRSDIAFGRQYRLDRFALAPHALRRTRRWLPKRLDSKLWRLWRRLAAAHSLPGIRAVVEQDVNHFHEELLSMPLAGTVWLDGYWQDERYFGAMTPELKRDFDLAEPASGRNAESARSLTQRVSVGIHCRRHHHRLANGKRLPARGRENLQASFYANALDVLREDVSPEHLVLFGDDPGWLRENLATDLPCTVVDWNTDAGDEVLDLWLMSRCRHFIVSNSTFAWWAAWLGSAPDKRVIAPRAQDLEYRVAPAAGWKEIEW